MPINERWNELSEDDWKGFAEAWLRELRQPHEPNERTVGQAVVSMNFTGPPDKQWLFIQLAVAGAANDDELGHIAAGPIEHLLGWHGDTYIDQVEALAGRAPKFLRAFAGIYRYRINDAVWARIQVLRDRASTLDQDVF